MSPRNRKSTINIVQNILWYIVYRYGRKRNDHLPHITNKCPYKLPQFIYHIYVYSKEPPYHSTVYFFHPWLCVLYDNRSIFWPIKIYFLHQGVLPKTYHYKIYSTFRIYLTFTASKGYIGIGTYLWEIRVNRLMKKKVLYTNILNIKKNLLLL